MMNFARVRLTGTVVRSPYIVREKGQVDYLSFSVEDTSGRVRVAAQGDVARALVDGGLLPASGDGVDVTGSLRIRGQGLTKLYLQAPNHLLLKANHQ